jgi:hypothetical protein
MNQRVLLDFDRDVDSSGEIQLLQLIDRPSRRLHDVEKALVSPDLELLGRLLVHVRRTVHTEFLNAGRQWNRARNPGSSSFGGLYDIDGRLIEKSRVIGS